MLNTLAVGHEVELILDRHQVGDVEEDLAGRVLSRRENVALQVDNGVLDGKALADVVDVY